MGAFRKLGIRAAFVDLRWDCTMGIVNVRSVALLIALLARSVPLAAADAAPPKELTLDCGSGVSLVLILINPGTFEMGSPPEEEGRRENETKHTVTLSKACYMGKYLVTQEQYKAVTGKNVSYFDGAKNPVEEVSWHDAADFCKKLNELAKGKLPDGMSIQLPTEAQWEYACRAGTKTRFYSGNRDGDLDDVGWYSENSEVKTHPVGEKKPNAFGLYDMHGHLWQWCLDAYSPNYETLPAVDPFNNHPLPALMGARVLRGGSYRISYPRDCRSAIRYGYKPEDCGNVIGFRIAAAAPLEPTKAPGKHF